MLGANDNYTREDTMIAKGIAILCMLFHHVYPNVCYKPFFALEDRAPLALLAATCKVCVSLLTILSGYGLAEQYRKRKTRTLKSDVGFVLSRYIQLFALYWPVNLLVSWISLSNTAVDLGNLRALAKVAVRLVGLRRVTGDWYLFAVVILYALFPLLYRLISRFGRKAVIATFAPWLLFFVSLFSGLSMKWDSALFYFFPFSAGICLSMENGLAKRADVSSREKVWTAILLIFAILLRQILALPMDAFVALAILKVQTTWGLRSKTLSIFGKESANIWLLQYALIAIVGRRMEAAPFLVRFVVVFASGLLISLGISWLKEITRFNLLIKKIRTVVGGWT